LFRGSSSGFTPLVYQRGRFARVASSPGSLTSAAASLGQFSHQHQVLVNGALALWCLAMAWLPVLIDAELARPRLSYGVRRWATVFPLGMYGASSFTVGEVNGIPAITSFGQVWTWVGFAAFLVVLTGLVRRILEAGQAPSLRPPVRADAARLPGGGGLIRAITRR
jgi:tellurite resistance protein TehA-like permease